MMDYREKVLGYTDKPPSWSTVSSWAKKKSYT